MKPRPEDLSEGLARDAKRKAVIRVDVDGVVGFVRNRNLRLRDADNVVIVRVRSR